MDVRWLTRGLGGIDGEVPDRRRLTSPRRTEQALLIAVYQAEIWCHGISGEDAGGFVPSNVQVVAVSATGLVAACYVDEPFLRGRGGRVRGDGRAVVWHRERVDLERGNL